MNEEPPPSFRCRWMGTMRKLVVLCAVTIAVAIPQPAAAKLPFFSLEMAPNSPRVGQPIVVTMRCWEDVAQSRPWTSCLGAEGTMAWIHPLDSSGDLNRHDWIAIDGDETASGGTEGRIALGEPGPYLLTPLWRDWRNGGRGFGRAIRFDVDSDQSPLPAVAIAAGSAVVLGMAGWILRRRQRSLDVLPQPH